MNGVILVNKEQNFTSFDVVAVMRGILKQKKIGHGGTLDPQAEGVLPVFLGDATKLCDFLPYDDKCYEAEMTLGLRTETEDIWGDVIREEPVICTEDSVRKAVLSFVGAYDQVPPMYSAKKVNGKKLYEYARQGIVIERKAEHVFIEKIEILNMALPKVRFRVYCSKGTYIRTLCSDIGEKLGCGACMSALKRVKHGHFLLEQAHTLAEIEKIAHEGKTADILISIEDLFPDLEKIRVTEAGMKALSNGNKLKTDEVSEGSGMLLTDQKRFRVYDAAGNFRAVYEYSGEEGLLKPVKMFLGDIKK